MTDRNRTPRRVARGAPIGYSAVMSRKKEHPESDALAAAPLADVLAELEQVVRELEAGERPLEEALALFERGVALSRAGQQRLAEAERRVEEILASGKLQPFSPSPS